jgi:hypothetical protein
MTAGSLERFADSVVGRAFTPTPSLRNDVHKAVSFLIGTTRRITPLVDPIAHFLKAS